MKISLISGKKLSMSGIKYHWTKSVEIVRVKTLNLV